MYFDLHTDILMDIVLKRLDHKKNIIKDYHLNELIEGQFSGGIWCYYTDNQHPVCEFDRAIDFILEELESCTDDVNIIRSKNDFTHNKLNVVLGLESIVPVENIQVFKDLFKNGFRHAMLTWNEQNKYGTGVAGDVNRGLTEEGKEIIEFMTENKMIVDLSHANIKTFYDISNHVNYPLLASHSNVDRLYAHRRNLNDEQIRTIIESDGLIGLTAVSGFLAKENATLNDLIHHLNDYKEKDLLDHLGFGFDFMHYLDSLNLPDFKTPLDTAILNKQLSHLTLEEKEKVSHLNAESFIKKVLK